MDIQLTDISGLEPTRRIRASEGDAGISFVALASYAIIGKNEKALEAGRAGYIERNIDPKTFVKEIENYLNA